MRRPSTTSLSTLGALAGGALLLMYARRDHSAGMTQRLAPQNLMRSVRGMAGRDIHMHTSAGTAVATAAALALGGWFLSSQLRKGPGGTTTVEESIEVEVPVSTAYNQWTQFEEFPRFMSTVESVRQVDDTHLHWRANVGGKVKEWDAEITEQIPDERIAWRSTSGVPNAGVVTFHKIGENRTRVMLQMDYTPETTMERLGDAVGGTKMTAKGNLKKFKALLEKRGHETGAWRGTVAQQH